MIELLLEECLFLYSKQYRDIVPKKHLLVKFGHYLKKKINKQNLYRYAGMVYSNKISL